MPTPRRPGVSISTPPPGSTSRSRGGRGVPALAVPVAGGPYVLHVLAHQHVGERRLARTGLPEQYGRAAAQYRGEDVQPVTVGRADGQHPHPRRGGLRVRDQVRQHVRITGQVGLGQHEQRLRPALPGQGDEALDAPEVQVHGERDRDHGVVHVGRQHLPVGPLGGRRAHERGTPRQQRPHHTVPARTDLAEVDHGPVPACTAPGIGSLVATSAVSASTVRTPSLSGTTASTRPRSTRTTRPGTESCPAERPKLSGEAVVPAVGGQRARRSRRRRKTIARETLHKGGPGPTRPTRGEK
ncbi:hypothetical protein SRIMM317S_02261 [Streptomyces rimosus subsp. rimosus]